MAALVDRLKKDYPKLAFASGADFRWSPASRTITYVTGTSDEASDWALIHEVAHALLEHNRFSSDFSLVRQEVDAWARAKSLAASYSLVIDQDYIEDCLDTYRDWLYRRSSCPRCTSASLQIDNSASYLCYNCNFSWQVSRERFCRPYRRASDTKRAII